IAIDPEVEKPAQIFFGGTFEGHTKVFGGRRPPLVRTQVDLYPIPEPFLTKIPSKHVEDIRATTVRLNRSAGRIQRNERASYFGILLWHAVDVQKFLLRTRSPPQALILRGQIVGQSFGNPALRHVVGDKRTKPVMCRFMEQEGIGGSRTIIVGLLSREST